MAFRVAKQQKPMFSMLATCMLVKRFTKLQRLFLATKSKMPGSEGRRRGCNLTAAKVNKVSKLGRAVKGFRKHISDLRLGARRNGACYIKRGAVQHSEVSKEKALTWEEEKVTPIVHLVEHRPGASCDSSDSDECCTSERVRLEQHQITVIMEEKASAQTPGLGMVKQGTETEQVPQGSYEERREDTAGGQWRAATYMKVPPSEYQGAPQSEATRAAASSVPPHSHNTHEGDLCPICRRLDTLVSTVQRGFNHMHRDINTLQNVSQYRGARLSQNVMSLVGAMHTLVRLHHFSTLPRRDVAIQTSIVLTERCQGTNVGAASNNPLTTSTETMVMSTDNVQPSNNMTEPRDAVVEVALDPDGDSTESMSIEESSLNSSDNDW